MRTCDVRKEQWKPINACKYNENIEQQIFIEIFCDSERQSTRYTKENRNETYTPMDNIYLFIIIIVMIRSNDGPFFSI